MQIISSSHLLLLNADLRQLSQLQDLVLFCGEDLAADDAFRLPPTLARLTMQGLVSVPRQVRLLSRPAWAYASAAPCFQVCKGTGQCSPDGWLGGSARLAAQQPQRLPLPRPPQKLPRSGAPNSTRWTWIWTSTWTSAPLSP